jgi:hypothetical protein
MKRFARQKDEAIVSIPPVVGVVPIRIEIPLAIIVVHIEQVRVAVGILYKIPSVAPPFEYSQGCILFGI